MILPSFQGYVLSFAQGVTVETPSEDCTIVRTPVTGRGLTFDSLSPGLREAVRLLASTGATVEGLAAIVMERDGADTVAKFYYMLMALADHLILSYGIESKGKRLAVLSPASPSFRFSPTSIRPDAEYSLSRFAFIRRGSGEIVMESPLAHGIITLYSQDAAAVPTGMMARAQALTSLCEGLPGLAPDAIALFLGVLVSAGFAWEVKPDGTCPEEEGPLAHWEFHDLLFHARSRLGRHTNPYGATYRFYGKIGPPPVLKPALSEEIIPLYRPDMDVLKEEDFPFTLVLEERKSIREYADEPVTAHQIGEFLFRTARMKALLSREFQDVSRRPYPGAGAAYELELYLTVHRCHDVPSGLYHYCPERHVLESISGMNELLDELLKDARAAAGMEETPEVLITVTARFPRLSWKYESIAYSLMLKDVGAIQQTMYLVATAMDLAPCALGGGDSDLFARAAGLDYYAEGSVGEFMLGSKRT